jgi:hypothetical protein
VSPVLANLERAHSAAGNAETLRIARHNCVGK